MNYQLRQILFMIGGLFAVALVIGALLIAFGTSGREVIVIDAGARQTFESHLMALDDQDWELANSLATDNCQIDSEDAEAARRDLARNGSSFLRAFQIEEVWFHENGVEALLGLETPRDLMLPGVASMLLVGGEWLISCG